jgi:hypothetical protein
MYFSSDYDIRQRNCSVAFSNTASIDIQLFSSALWLYSDRDNILLVEGGGGEQ